MIEIFYFVETHRSFIVLMLFANAFLVTLVIRKTHIYFNSYIYDALGGRDEIWTLHGKGMSTIRGALRKYERRGKKHRFYMRLVDKMKRSGYSGENAAMIYFSLKYVLLPILAILSATINYPNIGSTIILVLFLFSIMELIISGRRKDHNLKFQKNAYKIYKYLHNQVSSGVRVTDAIKSVYEIIEEKKLRRIFMQLAAGYELTLDIDNALEEFKLNYGIHEAETLCIALKQGVVTGDNRELLARQEDIMFKKYFNYIQAETDNCKLRSAAAVGLFCAIIVIMIAIPIVKDVIDSMSRIFIS